MLAKDYDKLEDELTSKGGSNVIVRYVTSGFPRSRAVDHVHWRFPHAAAYALRALYLTSRLLNEDLFSP